MGGSAPTDDQHDWVTVTLAVDPRDYPDAAPVQAKHDGAPRPKGGTAAPAGGPIVLEVKGSFHKVQSDPDDPFSPERDEFEMDLPPLQEPMPKVRPHNDVLIKYLQDIPEFASGRAVGYCQAVAEACEGFEKYAKRRIKELTKPSFGAEALFGALLGVVATVVTGGLGGEALEGLAKSVADGVKDAIKDAIKEQGGRAFKKASGDESKADELEDMAEALTAHARRGANQVKDVTVANVAAQVDPLIQKLTSGGKLSKEEDAFILPFAAADGGGKDRLYRRLGIPDLTAAKSVRLNLFGRLTWTFEDQIWEDRTKDDIAAQKGWLENTDSPEEKAHARQNIDELEEQAKRNARATAHNAWGKFKEETT